MAQVLSKLFGIIGVAYQGKRTFYVKRSRKMHYYPGVWSLLSTQFDPDDLPDVRDLSSVQKYMDQISRERLGGISIVAKEFLTSGNSDLNPIERDVYLYLYRVELGDTPVVNPDYYTEMEWMTAAQYERYSVGAALRPMHQALV